MNNNDSQTPSHLVTGYHKMMTRVKKALSHASETTLKQHIENAKEKAVELEELSREEAQRISDYLHKDLQDAAEFIITTEQALAEWMRFDLELIEEQFLDLFSVMVDHTKVELENLAECARQATEWYTGEITGPGTLQCDNCGKQLHFHHPDHIPPCPNCGSVLFKRQFDEIEQSNE
jgi:rubrerythrin